MGTYEKQAIKYCNQVIKIFGHLNDALDKLNEISSILGPSEPSDDGLTTGVIEANESLKNKINTIVFNDINLSKNAIINKGIEIDRRKEEEKRIKALKDANKESLQSDLPSVSLSEKRSKSIVMEQ